MFSSIQIACELANRYDYGVSVAHSGLPLGWACSTLGLDVGIIKTHRREDRVRLTDFSCLTARNITGKSVIILEHDMASGATLHSLVKKLAPLEPRKIDVAFNLIRPSQKRGSISQILGRMPQEIDEVFIPHSFGASAVLNALEIFSHGLHSQKLDGAKVL